MNVIMKQKLIPLTAIVLFATASLVAQECELDINLTAPTSRFAVIDGETVADLWTQRTWMRCPLGQTLDDNDTDTFQDDICVTDESSVYNIEDALVETAAVNASNFAGYNTWRIANTEELLSIVERACTPALNFAVFPSVETEFISSKIGTRGHPVGVSYEYGSEEIFIGDIGEVNSAEGRVRLVRD